MPLISLPSHGPGAGQLTLPKQLSGLCLAAWALTAGAGVGAANSSAQAMLWQGTLGKKVPRHRVLPHRRPPLLKTAFSFPDRLTKNSLDCKSVNAPFLPLMGWCE